MEANRKRSRGFLKGKLAPFYKGPKPSSTVHYTTTNVKPNHSSPSPASVGFVVHHDYAIAQSNPKVSIVVADKRGDLMSHLEELYGVPADESVDTKAGIYISMVQERLMLERVNTEPKKLQEK
ncbi:uncharacterized protein LOC133285831 [Gastrolobium bilobum]|uniref:uncharacterized protein LOC133285831 n=1 Tax=Gastrolobium bilobum TaxID=150636 RepID=UPI002AB1999D|nr:uncharacterized protein LOC133285831 [Gastrolobium bilobum]